MRSGRLGLKGWFWPVLNPERLAFTLHRVTGFYMALYLVLHIFMTQNAIYETSWARAMALVESPLVKVGEVFLVFSVFFHGINGIRLLLVEYFNVCIGRPKRPVYPYRIPSLHGCPKALLYATYALSIALTIVGSMYMLGLVRLV